MLTRRRFLSLAGSAGLGLALPNLLGGWKEVPHRKRTLRLGYLAPPRPNATQLSAAFGAALAVEESRRAAELLDRRVRLVSGIATESDLVNPVRDLANEGVIAVVGCGGSEWSEAARHEVESRRLLYLNIGCSDDRIRSECHPLTFHIEASKAMYLDALAEGLVRDGTRRWLVVADESDDERARRAIESRGGTVVGSVSGSKATRQWLLGAVEKNAAEAVCLVLPDGGARLLSDWPTDMSRLKIACVPNGTAALRVPTIQPVVWHSQLTRFGAGQLNQRFERHFRQPLSSAGWAGWFAMKVLWESSLKVNAMSAVAIGQWLTSERAGFDGLKGVPLSFRSWDHQLRQPMYLVQRGTDRLTPLTEVPRAVAAARSRETLDRLGDGSDTSCEVAG